eukprot:1149281-Pelagomonas_calceolata.AAC.2
MLLQQQSANMGWLLVSMALTAALYSVEFITALAFTFDARVPGNILLQYSLQLLKGARKMMDWEEEAAEQAISTGETG